MDPDSLGSEIMAHEGCDEMEDEGEKELPDLGLGANVVHDSDDEDNAVFTMLAELPRPPGGPFWSPEEYFCAARPLANQLEQLSTMASGWIVKLSDGQWTAALRDDIDKWMIAAAVQQSKMQSRLEPDPWTGFQETVNYRPLYDLDFEEHTDLIARHAILARAMTSKHETHTEPSPASHDEHWEGVPDGSDMDDLAGTSRWRRARADGGWLDITAGQMAAEYNLADDEEAEADDHDNPDYLIK